MNVMMNNAFVPKKAAGMQPEAMNGTAGMMALANVRGGEEAPSLSGEVRFFQEEAAVLVVVRVTGLPQNATGFYGFHIHEGTDCGGEMFADTKAHFNPTNAAHPNHAGDLPPLLSYAGNAYMAVMTDRFRVSDVIGRTVVIHQNADDFTTQPSGNSGMKIACGVIQKV